MSAASQTWTFPAGQKYVDKDGIEHTIATSQDCLFAFTDTGSGGVFKARMGDTSKVVCTDGFTFDIELDQRFQFESGADGAANISCGELCIVEEGNVRTDWKVTSLTLADCDGVGSNNVTEMKLEQVDNTSRKITWALITSA